MSPVHSSPPQLHERVSAVLAHTEAVEASYEPLTVGQLVALRAHTHGTQVAIDIFERGEQATYAEMDRESNRYARALRSFGVRKGDRVAVMLPNRLEFPLLWFALAKMGAVLVPLNMRYTCRELEYVLTDTQAKFAVVDESVYSEFIVMDPWPSELARDRVIVAGDSKASDVSNLGALARQADDSPVDDEVGMDDLLNIQYTSGTTGFPKGCMLTHEYWSVTARVFAGYDEEPYKRNLSWSPFFYAYGQMEFMKSYENGGTLFLAQKLSASRLLSWVKAFQVEWCTLPELVALQIETDGEAASLLKQAGPPGGWSSAAKDHFRAHCDAYAHDPYAMTEIGWGTQMPRALGEMAHAIGSLGIRAPFRELRLVTEEGVPALVGQVGELWVRGRGIFKGYWNRPEANAVCFEDGWFKTGDLLRRDELDFYFFVGRAKDMIRRSGENISAREVEAVIGELPEIADVAAVPVPDTMRGEEVKICLEVHDGVLPDGQLVTRILEYAKPRLAAFKMPRYLAFVSELPRTVSSQKILKRELIGVPDPLAGVYDVEERRWR